MRQGEGLVVERFEQAMFGFRAVILGILIFITLVSSLVAFPVRFDPDLEKQLPQDHPYSRTALDFKDKIAGLNSVQIVVETKSGNVWTPSFLKLLNDVTQEVLYLPGISRESVSSLWTSNTFVYEATETAVEGRQLVPSNIVPESLSPADVLQIRADAYKGGYRGRLFGLDDKAAMIHATVAPLMPDGQRTDLIAVANSFDSKIRAKFETDDVSIRVIGFTKFAGDIANAAGDVVSFFALAFVLNAIVLWLFCRSVFLTLVTVLCSAASVVWLFAIIRVFDLSLNPLGLVIPFLIYVIGVSHGVQQINRFIVSVVIGDHTPVEAAQRTFRRLLLPGFFSISTVLVGFATILLVPIPLVSDLAVIALIGMALKYVSNLVMLPLAISYARLQGAAVTKQKEILESRKALMAVVSRDAQPGPALIGLGAGGLLAVVAVWGASGVGVGHQRPGAQELWESARYNVDSAAIARNFNLDLDSFVAVAVAPPDSCVDFRVMTYLEQFGVAMRAVPGVKSVMSLSEASRFVNSIMQEGNLKWRVVPRATDVLAATNSAIPESTGLRNSDCSLMPIALYLTDHKDETLRRVAAAAEAYLSANKMENVTVRLATGNGGVLYAINDAVRSARILAPLLVFGAIGLLIFAAYRDWRAVPCCLAPLALANALGLWVLSELDGGLTVSTLPVFVLAVGIGVDYGIYLYERIEVHLREGLLMPEAFSLSMQEEGAAIVYTALTLAAGVGCWVLSGLKFQADMGWLLAFLVLANAVAAITILPAMAVVLDRVLPRRR